jgi:hypothetical protein
MFSISAADSTVGLYITFILDFAISTVFNNHFIKWLDGKKDFIKYFLGRSKPIGKKTQVICRKNS